MVTVAQSNFLPNKDNDSSGNLTCLGEGMWYWIDSVILCCASSSSSFSSSFFFNDETMFLESFLIIDQDKEALATCFNILTHDSLPSWLQVDFEKIWKN